MNKPTAFITPSKTRHSLSHSNGTGNVGDGEMGISMNTTHGKASVNRERSNGAILPAALLFLRLVGLALLLLLPVRPVLAQTGNAGVISSTLSNLSGAGGGNQLQTFKGSKRRAQWSQ